MWFLLFVLAIAPQKITGYWDREVKCPEMCKCHLQHTSEIPINRFMPKDEEIDSPDVPQAIVLESNDVYYDGDEFTFDEHAFFRSATCIVPIEVAVEHLLNEIPKEIQSLTLLQASGSGNKTLRLSDFVEFEDLKILELQSAQQLGMYETSFLFLDIDATLDKLEYFNLERVILQNSNERIKTLEDEVVIFEHIFKNEDGQDLTFLEKRPGEILPYKTYVENIKGEDGPLFMGFVNLVLLRLYECEIHHIHREMFQGLKNLHYLVLEKNNLQFISDFAFYGTPNLVSLSLAWNRLLSIQITDLAGLLELEYLDLSNNNFTQLSELSLPPFPKLKLCNFANNPITDVFPNTFEVMNTTYALIVGGLEQPLTLQTNAFVGLNMLMSLKLFHLNIPLLEREILRGMPNLQVLVMTGNIPEIQYDAFLELVNLDTLIISSCNITKLSVDSFIGLEKLRVLDLSRNNLSLLPPGIFDDLPNLSELYLHQNHFQRLPQHIFSKSPARLIRLNDNPWHCSCEMSDWKPMVVNRIKQKTIKTCDVNAPDDKGLSCQQETSRIYYKYIYENAMSPKCASPRKFLNWSVFQVMRKRFKCPDYKPKMRKRTHRKYSKLNKAVNITTSTDNNDNVPTAIIPTSTEQSGDLSNEFQMSYQRAKLEKLKQKYKRTMKRMKLSKSDYDANNEDNNLLAW